MTNRKSHTRFRLVPEWMILDDLERALSTLFQNKCVFGTHHGNLNEDRPTESATKMYVAQWLFLAIQGLSFNAPCPRNPREYPHKPYIARNLRVIALHLRRWYCRSIFIQIFVVPGSENACILNQCAKWPFKVIQGRWFWHQSKAGMRLPIVISSNLVRRSFPVCRSRRNITGFLQKTAPHPYSTRILGCDPWTRLPMLGLRGAKTLS